MVPGREQQAAAVAARLKAFHADPARQGPRFAEGREPLPEGGIVLRFAQGRIPAALAPSAVEAHQLRRAAELFVRRVCLWDRADHYQALCAPRDAAAETLKENYHLLMALLHPDRQEGMAQPWPQSCAQRVNLAYATLGDEGARREYDQRLRSERPRRRPAAAGAAPQPSALRRDVRFAKSLLAVSAVVAVLIAAGLLIHDDEWSDQSVLQASLARLRTNPLPGSDRPRYVGATAMSGQRASDTVAADDSSALDVLKPLMRAFVRDDPKPYDAPRAEAAAKPQQAQPVAAVFETPAAAPAFEAPAAPARAGSAPPARPVAVPSQVPLIVAQAALPIAQVPAAAAPGPSNAAIEDLVVALVSYYEAGDADRIVGLVDTDSIGFFARNRLREAYADFFRATRSRRLRIDRLAWNATPGAASARGAATVRAEYADRAPLEKRVDMEIDIVLRDGKPRLARLSLFPWAP